MADVDEYPNYRILLEDNRDKLVKTIRITQFFAVLRTCSVFDVDDEQSITQNVTLSTNTQKAGAFLDLLATKGQRGFKVFLSLLETLHPELYKQLSGKDADPTMMEISTMDCCQQHKITIQKKDSEIAEMANHVKKLEETQEHLLQKVNELQWLNDRNMTKLQHYDALQQTLKMALNDLEDARYSCQNLEQEATRYKHLYEQNMKHLNKTKEDLEKAREVCNSLETRIDSFLQEHHDLLSRLQDLQNKNMVVSREKSRLEKLIKEDSLRKKREGYPDLGYFCGSEGYPDLGYFCGSQSESSKNGSRTDSMVEVIEDLGSKQVTSSSTTNTDTSLKQKEMARFILNTSHQDSVDKQIHQIFGTVSPIAKYREPSTTLLRTHQNGVDKSDHWKPSSSCGSIGSSNDQEDLLESGSGSVPGRPVVRQTKNRCAQTCFGEHFLVVDSQAKEVYDKVEDPYDCTKLILKRRSMSLTDIHMLCNNDKHDFEVSNPDK